jgi:four helix bundle protein
MIENLMNPKELKGRTKEFAHRVVKLALALPNTVLGNHIRKQLIRCGTSVAANHRAATMAQTEAFYYQDKCCN